MEASPAEDGSSFQPHAVLFQGVKASEDHPDENTHRLAAQGGGFPSRAFGRDSRADEKSKIFVVKRGKASGVSRLEAAGAGKLEVLELKEGSWVIGLGHLFDFLWLVLTCKGEVTMRKAASDCVLVILGWLPRSSESDF